MKRRGCGILLHISSLPSPHGVGDLGPWAYRFVDFLAEARQCYWQILPINPTSTAHGNSPYNSDSAFAGNPLLISLEKLQDEGLLSKAEIHPLVHFPEHKVAYETVTSFKFRLLRLAYERALPSLESDPRFTTFCQEQGDWLEDYTLFRALKTHFQGVSWDHFPKAIKYRDRNALHRCREEFSDQIRWEKFLQYTFYRQWLGLKDYSNRIGVEIIGDVPIYVQYDSSDVWTHPEIFKLDADRKPIGVSGVPPDYFSKTGQLWGNPVYNWEALKATHYQWWIRRMEHNLKLFDWVRLDHFRGFVAYWEVPTNHPNAIQGRWVQAPAEDFFKTLLHHFPSLPIIAEDLGFITPDVQELINRLHFPGMKVLLFAFGEDLPVHPFAPHNYTRNCVVYTGTHDNNTVRGWFLKEASPEDRQRLSAYLGREVDENTVHLELVRLAMMSVANTVILPMQDVLGLDEEARMNRPGTTHGNWEWRLTPAQFTNLPVDQLAQVTAIYGRDPHL